MKTYLLLLAGILAASCSVKPQPIVYGTDGCHFCKMTIVDNQHAAELVTVKGRAFKYDAIECMMNHLADWNEPAVELYLIADYATPGELIDARDAHYLIAESIPSPMGAFLSGFADPKSRHGSMVGVADKTFNWDELKDSFGVNP